MGNNTRSISMRGDLSLTRPYETAYEGMVRAFQYPGLRRFLEIGWKGRSTIE